MRFFAKGGTHAFIAPADGSGASQQGGDDGDASLFMRLLENCFGRLPRADVSRSVQGNLFPCASVSLGRRPTKQIP